MFFVIIAKFIPSQKINADVHWRRDGRLPLMSHNCPRFSEHTLPENGNVNFLRGRISSSSRHYLNFLHIKVVEQRSKICST